MIRKWQKRVVLTLIGLAGATVVLEVGLRLLGANQPVLYEVDPVLGYRLKPNQQVSFFGNDITINQLGVRDARTFDAKAPGTTRILVLGDSVTWGGVRIPQRYLFTATIERELGDAEVINAGVNGYSVWRMMALYREHLKELKPDIVVLYIIPGDFYRPPVTDLVRSSPGFPLEKPTFALSSAIATGRVVLSTRFDWDWMRPPRPDRPRENLTEDERVRRNMDAILLLKDQLSENQKLVVVVAPHPDDPKNPPLPASFRTLVTNARLDTLMYGDVQLRDRENFVDHIHLNPRGHARVAQSLVEFIRGIVGE